jgi:voltage-gated potassium channel Kch
MQRVTFGDRLRYQFDNFMSRGTIALVGALFALTLLLILVGTLILRLGRLSPDTSSFPGALWASIVLSIGTGRVGTISGRWYRFVGLGITLGGIFIVSALIGVLSSGLHGRLGDLRRGRSRIIETGHVVILGWSPQVFTIVAELALANRFAQSDRGSSGAGRSACIAILADKDKVAMEEEIRQKVRDLRGTRVVCRTGSPVDVDDLQIVSPHTARSVIVVAPVGPYPDLPVVKSLMALGKDHDGGAHRYHTVAAIQRPADFRVARIVGGDEAKILMVDGLISRLIAQSCRQPGLSVVYGELFSFKGAAIRFHEAPALVGTTYGHALFRFRNAALIGLRYEDGRVQLNPPMETTIRPGDKVIDIATEVAALDPQGALDYGLDLAVIGDGLSSTPSLQRLLILGWNRRGPLILEQLGYFMPPGSQVLVVAPVEPQQMQADAADQAHRMQVTFEKGNPVNRATLERLAAGGYEFVIILSPPDAPDIQLADAATMVSLVHLRDIGRSTGHTFAIVTEILDVRNRDLAAVTSADDVIISERLAALALAEVAANKDVAPVFVELLTPGGPEILLRPAGDYITPNQPANFYTVLEAARRRGQTAIGYRLLSEAGSPDRAFGVHLNPDKQAKFNFTGQDRIIVLEAA